MVGDTLLDRDVEGAVNRLCPDSPVPVLDETAYADRPGGAGLAAALRRRRRRHRGGAGHRARRRCRGRPAELPARRRRGAGVRAAAAPGPRRRRSGCGPGGRVLLRLDRGGARRAQPGAPPRRCCRLLAGAAAVLVSDYGRGRARQPALRAALAATRGAGGLGPASARPGAGAGRAAGHPERAEARELAGDRRAAPGWPPPPAAGAGAAAAAGGPGAVAVTLGARRRAALPRRADARWWCRRRRAPTGTPAGRGTGSPQRPALALARGALVVRGGAGGGRRGLGVRGGRRRGRRAARPGARLPTGADRCRRSGPGPPRSARWSPRSGAAGGTVVATGGCFDLLHAGHVATLRAARQLGDCLVVCLNSDDSVRRLKGPTGRWSREATGPGCWPRWSCVDAVVVFDETTPHAVLAGCARTSGSRAATTPARTRPAGGRAAAPLGRAGRGRAVPGRPLHHPADRGGPRWPTTAGRQPDG